MIDEDTALVRDGNALSGSDSYELDYYDSGYDCVMDFRLRYGGTVTDADRFRLETNVTAEGMDGADCYDLWGASNPPPCHFSWRSDFVFDMPDDET